LCGLLQKKNYDLYLKHEVMLDEEKKQRTELADQFHKRMALVTE
jgi:hypothetical protein